MKIRTVSLIFLIAPYKLNHIETHVVSRYTSQMIQSFNHKGLKKFFETGSKAGIQANHESKLQVILGRLNASINPQDMDLPGLYLHELTGDRKGTWSVRVSGNWRVTFQFIEGHAEVVDYEDYH